VTTTMIAVAEAAVAAVAPRLMIARCNLTHDEVVDLMARTNMVGQEWVSEDMRQCTAEDKEAAT